MAALVTAPVTVMLCCEGILDRQQTGVRMLRNLDNICLLVVRNFLAATMDTFGFSKGDRQRLLLLEFNDSRQRSDQHPRWLWK